MFGLWQDARHGLRLLWRTPGVTAAVVLVLALGIGANSAIFSVVNSLLLRPLPFRDPGSLVQVMHYERSSGQDRPIVSTQEYLEWKSGTSAFTDLTAWNFLYFNLSGEGQPERVQGLQVTASYFPVMGMTPALGRGLLPEDEQRGAPKVLVLSNGLWRRRYGGENSVLGRRILVEGEPYTVVGVMPQEFQMFRVLNRELDIWTPFPIHDNDPMDPVLFVYGRLRPGVPLAQAQAEIGTVSDRQEKLYPATNTGLGGRVVPMQQSWTRVIRPVLLLLQAAVGFVLLMACANIANLLLVRGAGRAKEMAVRAAIGAGRLRLLRQGLVESILQTFFGGLAGLVMASLLIRVLNGSIPYTAVNRWSDFQLDFRVFLFSLGLALVVGLLAGLAPALQASLLDPGETLKESTRGAAGSRRGRRVRQALVVGEVALSVMLLTGAALLLRSTWGMHAMDRGLRLENLLKAQLWLPKARYPQPVQSARFFDQLVSRVAALPGVESAAAVNFVPLDMQSTVVPIELEGKPPPPPGQQDLVRYFVVTPDYFRTMGIPLRGGRAFDAHDDDEKHGVVIISQRLATQFWGSGDPLGRRLKTNFPPGISFWQTESSNAWLKVVGVAGDVAYDGLWRPELPQMYLPLLQNPSSIMNVVLRAASPLGLLPALRAEVQKLDPEQPVFDAKTMEDVLAGSFSRPNLMAGLLMVFAALALLLAAVGVYGVISYSVAQRTQEMGVRMALGAQPGDLVRLVLRQGMGLVLLGVVLGMGGAWASAHLLSDWLFGMRPRDPLTFTASAGFLILVALAACYLPARRAARLDPMTALRCE
jgi:putative ABC transport system permease protein